MNTEKYIPLATLVTYYQIEMPFFDRLNEAGLIEIITIKKVLYVHRDSMANLEKMIRMHHDLDINIEGIDIVFNLLRRIDELRHELASMRNRLGIYE